MTRVGEKKDINIEIPQGQKLSSIAPQLMDIIKDQEDKHGQANLEINAPMGIGKNYTTVNLLAPELEKMTGYKSAIVCPLNALPASLYVHIQDAQRRIKIPLASCSLRLCTSRDETTCLPPNSRCASPAVV